jgi:hypothetical protein
MIVEKTFSTDMLRRAGEALTFSALIMSAGANAADLRLRIDPAVARATTTPAPAHKTRKQLFEEFLQWQKQQSR